MAKMMSKAERDAIDIPVARVMVKSEHIANAVKRDSHRCMIADAVREHIPTARHISVDLQKIEYSDAKTNLRYRYLTPPFAQSALVKFDQGLPVKPFQFRLTRNTGMVLQRVGWQANHPNLSRPSRNPLKKKNDGKKQKKYGPPKEREFGLKSLVL